jgi:hypothetical protein
MKKSTLFFLSVICGLSLAACAQSTPTPAVKPVEIKKEIPAPAVTAPVVTPIQPSAKEAAPMTYPNSPSTTPPITAAELRKKILTLIASLQSREDTNQANVEKIMNVALTEDDGSGGRFSMRGDVQEGWGYWYYVRKLDDEPDSMIKFHLYHNQDLVDDILPKTCTLDNESMAQAISALGFKRSDKLYRMKGRMWSGFWKEMPQQSIILNVTMDVYRAENGTHDGALCVKEIGIGTDPIHE